MIKGGPKIIDDSLVACLDAHDAKSYAGEPITNMAYNIGILGQGSTWEAITSVPGSEGQTGPGSNVNFKKLNDNSVANTFLNSNGKIFRNYVNNPATSDSSSFNNNGGFRYASSINLTSGGASGYVIISFWCYLVTGYQGYGVNGLASAYMQFQDSGGTYTGNGSLSRFVDGVSKSAPETFNADTGRWKFVQLRFTKPANSTAIRNFYIYADKNTQGEMYVCQLQIEDRSDGGFYQVPFVEGASSRSATDGWVDRSGNSNDGTLVNGTDTGVSHYRDGEVIMPVSASYLDLDGSDDYIDGPIVAPNIGAFTYEAVIYRTSSDFLAVGSGTALGGGTYMKIFVYDAGMRVDLYAPQGLGGGWKTGNTIPNVSNTFVENNTYHVTVVNGGTVFYFYKNGVSLGSYDHSYLSNTSSTRLGILRNHVQSVGGTGRVYLARMYDKALTAAEVLQNYNATKNRFT
mgnify:CR=1 FL=1